MVPAGPEMPVVKFTNSNEFTAVPEGATLLKAAQAAGVDITWSCGGNAICMTCRCRPLPGQADRLSLPDKLEQELIAAVGLTESWRLACQARVLGNVEVEITPVMT
jgi:ferredoxin